MDNPLYRDHMDNRFVCGSCGRPLSGDGSLCRTCGDEIGPFGICKCGDQVGRLTVCVGALLLNAKRSEVRLEAAAIRYLGGDKSPESSAELKTALDYWLIERDVDVGRTGTAKDRRVVGTRPGSDGRAKQGRGGSR